MGNYKKSNFSKISQKLFWLIYNQLPNDYKKTKKIYFATLKNNTVDNSGVNNEYKLNIGDMNIMPDFLILDDKKIIEFDGTYYHRIGSVNKNREIERDSCINRNDFSVIHIDEKDFITNKEEVVEKCLQFLFDK